MLMALSEPASLSLFDALLDRSVLEVFDVIDDIFACNGPMIVWGKGAASNPVSLRVVTLFCVVAPKVAFMHKTSID